MVVYFSRGDVGSIRDPQQPEGQLTSVFRMKFAGAAEAAYRTDQESDSDRQTDRQTNRPTDN